MASNYLIILMLFVVGIILSSAGCIAEKSPEDRTGTIPDTVSGSSAVAITSLPVSENPSQEIAIDQPEPASSAESVELNGSTNHPNSSIAMTREAGPYSLPVEINSTDSIEAET